MLKNKKKALKETTLEMMNNNQLLKFKQFCMKIIKVGDSEDTDSLLNNKMNNYLATRGLCTKDLATECHLRKKGCL